MSLWWNYNKLLLLLMLMCHWWNYNNYLIIHREIHCCVELKSHGTSGCMLRMCLIKLLLVVNFKLQCAHGKGLSPEWISMCLANDCFVATTFPHIWQVRSSSSLRLSSVHSRGTRNRLLIWITRKLCVISFRPVEARFDGCGGFGNITYFGLLELSPMC